MEFLICLLIFLLMAYEVLEGDIELTPQTFDTAYRTGKIRRDHIGSCMDAVLMKNTDISFEVTIQGRQFVNRDVEYDGILYDGILFVRELLTCQHHIIQGYGELTANGICCFAPFPAGIGHQIAPAAEL